MTPHEELLALPLRISMSGYSIRDANGNIVASAPNLRMKDSQIEHWLNQAEQVVSAVNGAADLTAKLEAERKAREEAERKLHAWAVEANIAGIMDGADAPKRVIGALVQRAEAAESHLATIFERTRERCAKVCVAQRLQYRGGQYAAEEAARRCENAIRALAPEGDKP